MLGIIKQVKKLLELIHISQMYGFHQINDAVDDYKNNMSAGKILLKPSLTV